MTTTNGAAYLALRPLLSDFVLSMPRGAAVVYPKDAGQIVDDGRHLPGRAGGRGRRRVGGADLLAAARGRRPGPGVQLRAACRTSPRSPRTTSSASSARRTRPGGSPSATWPRRSTTPRSTGSCSTCWRPGTSSTPSPARWCPAASSSPTSRRPPSSPAPSRRCASTAAFTEPSAWESMVRGWHVEGLAVRPEHRMIGHTGFLLTARRMAPGVPPPVRRRRPAKANAEAYEESLLEHGRDEARAAGPGPAAVVRAGCQVGCRVGSADDDAVGDPGHVDALAGAVGRRRSGRRAAGRRDTAPARPRRSAARRRRP